METLKIAFVDFWPEINQEDIFTPILSKHYNVVVDNAQPDVIFHSIFNGMKDIVKLKNLPKAKRILWLAENFKANQFKTDFTISFDPQDETNFRLPLWQAFIMLNPTLPNVLYTKPTIDEVNFERFCSFTVSNGSNFVRNGVYNTLNSYKRVHSYGKYMPNDFSLQNLGKNTNTSYWRSTKELFFYNHSHKFSICYENTSAPYYCTEKLMDAFISKSIPIYYGDPKAIEDFNEKAFINVHKHNKNGESVIDVVRRLNENDQAYIDMYNEPVFTPEQKQKLEDNLGNFEEWLIDIINI